LLPLSARAQDLTTLIKIFGIGYVVKQYAAPLNEFVNSVLANKGVKVLEQTKVVPVLSIGVGQASYIGAAQVSGTKAALAKVEAVAQLEADFNTVFRIKALVPIDSTNPIADGIHRVSGVGVTAVIDIRI
jgi:AICAR transformylase/IMP cyclohydrolase PurH